MTMRKTREDEIRTLKDELHTRTKFLEDEVKNLENFIAIGKERKLTNAEFERAKELGELAKANLDWIEKHRKEIAEYRKPAIVIAS